LRMRNTTTLCLSASMKMALPVMSIRKVLQPAAFSHQCGGKPSGLQLSLYF
jgi:hypothetical protein